MSLDSKLAKWVILLSQGDMKFVPEKAVKGQTIAIFMVDQPIPTSFKLHESNCYETLKVNVKWWDPKVIPWWLANVQWWGPIVIPQLCIKDGLL